jgi:VWFA-related protein
MRRALSALALATALLTSNTSVLAQTDELTIYAGVVDKNGAPVPDLTEKDFIVREDGMAREILRVVSDHDPLQIALLIDNSRIMRSQITELRRAVVAFVDGTREGVSVALIGTGERPTIIVPYTTDHAALKKGANSLFATPDSGNYVLDAIAEASDGLRKRSNARSVIAVITGVGDISYREYTETLRVFRNSGAALHVLTLGTANGGVDKEFVIGKGTDETGGRNEVVLAAMGLADKASQMAGEISHQYRVTFARPQRLIPPKNTEISARNPDLHARGMLMKTEKPRP